EYLVAGVLHHPQPRLVRNDAPDLLDLGTVTRLDLVLEVVLRHRRTHEIFDFLERHALLDLVKVGLGDLFKRNVLLAAATCGQEDGYRQRSCEDMPPANILHHGTLLDGDDCIGATVTPSLPSDGWPAFVALGVLRASRV